MSVTDKIIDDVHALHNSLRGGQNVHIDEELLISALDDVETRAMLCGDIADILEKTNDVASSRLVQSLVNALDDGELDVRYSSAMSLAAVGDSTAENALCMRLCDPEDSVRAAASEALMKIGTSRSIGPLIQALSDPDFLVRSNAVQALGEIGDPRATNALIAMLDNENEEVREAAVSSLGMISDDRSVIPLIGMLLRDNDLTVDEPWVFDALAAINHPEIDRIINENTEFDELTKSYILGEISYLVEGGACDS